MNDMKNTDTPAPKPKKRKGPLRTEAAAPFVIVVLLVFIYFHFFFDYNLKKVLEYAGYQALGAEVDIGQIKTSFWHASFRAENIEVTNAEKPTHNIVSIGDVRFGLLWDGLLRAKFVVNEMAVEKIEIDSPRKFPGKVKPPEAEVTKSNEPGTLEKNAKALKGAALNTLQQKYSGNALGDIATLLAGGGSGEPNFAGLENQLASKQKLKEVEADFQEKQKKWNEKLKTLPNNAEIQELGKRFSAIKTKNFKSPAEVQQSLQQISAVLKDANQKYQTVQDLSKDLTTDLKNFDQQMNELNELIKKDTATLQAHLQIPELDAKSLSEAVFAQYMGKYLRMFAHYKALADQYLPPNVLKKKTAEPDPSLVPHPRARGVTYEFGRPKAYPLFWIKKISISSQAGASAYSGNVQGVVTDVTSNQRLVGRPTIVTLSGDFPSQQVTGLFIKASIDGRPMESLIDFEGKVGSYPLADKPLVSSPEVSVAFQNAVGHLETKGQLIGLRDFSFTLSNEFQKVAYEVQAKNQIAQDLLKNIFAGIPTVTLNADGQGALPLLSRLDVNSNLGPELQKGLSKQLEKKIDEAKAKLKEFMDKNVGSEKAKLDSQVTQQKSQIDGQLKKTQDQIQSQQKQGENKMSQAQKDSINKAAKNLGDQLKKAIGPDGEKKLNDLKKQFGL
jgi:uncharacterized protein (TIGR03545 family)